ncbi:ATP-grasp domain-containing protein [Micromonospora globbae]|uniref:ATP-grasp domain-containing protein n=1 Tax=Micromonospora globbae TaxID=1894969 RepID=UPI00341DC11D
MVILMRDPTWERDLAHHVIEADTSSEDASMAGLDSWCTEAGETIDGVFTFTEYAVPLAARIAQHYGLPHIAPRVARLCRDKFAMRKALDGSGVQQPRYGLAKDSEQAVAVAEDIGFPVVVKPIIGAASVYVRRVDTVDELRENFSSLQALSWVALAADPLCTRLRAEYEEAMLIEEYIEGNEMSYEAIAVEGTVHPLTIHRKPLPMTGPYFPEYYYRTPAELPEALETQVHQTVTAAISALGINMGATHSEVRVNEQGVFVVEVGARVGGMSVYQSVKAVTGVDMISSVSTLAMGEYPDLSVKDTGTWAGFCYFFPARAGTVARIDGMQEAQRLKGVTEIDVYCREGDVVAVPPVAKQGIGHAFFTASSSLELDRTYRALQDCIAVVIQGG